MLARPRRLPHIEAYRLAGTELLGEPDHYSPPLSSVITGPIRCAKLKRNAKGGQRMDRVQSRIQVLRVLVQANDPNRAVLIENAINEYLKGEPGTLRISLERLCDAIDREKAEKRRGEDWSIARDYVRSRLRRLA
jgi:hypothetical protein